MVLNLDDIKDKQQVTGEQWLNRENVNSKKIILTDTTVETANFLYMLSFYIGGSKNKDSISVDIINDNRNVEEQDIKLGGYYPQDLGKNRADVLAKRYTGIFNYNIRIVNFKMLEKTPDTLIRIDDVIIVSFSGDNEQDAKLFKAIKDMKTQLRVKGGLTWLRVREKGKEIEFNNVISRVYGDVLGNLIDEEEEKDKKRLVDKIQESQLKAQYVLNFINQLLVKNENSQGHKGLEVQKLNYDTETGKTKLEYFKGKVTLFHKLFIYDKISTHNFTDKELLDFEDSLLEGIEKTVDEIYSVSIQTPTQVMRFSLESILKSRLDLMEYELNRKKTVFKNEKDKLREKLLFLTAVQQENKLYNYIIKKENRKFINKVIAEKGDEGKRIIISYHLIKYMDRKGWKITD